MNQSWVRSGGYVRPPMGGGRRASTLLLPTGSCILDADNPNTNYSGQARFHANLHDTYSNKKKAVFKFPRKLMGAEYIAVLGYLQLQWVLQYASGSVTPLQITTTYLAKEINTDFDPAVATWNTPGFAEGSSVWTSSSKLHINGFNRGFTNSIDYDDVGGDSTKLKDFWMVASGSGSPVAVQGAEFYGLVVTAKITSDISPNSAAMDGILTPHFAS